MLGTRCSTEQAFVRARTLMVLTVSPWDTYDFSFRIVNQPRIDVKSHYGTDWPHPRFRLYQSSGAEKCRISRFRNTDPSVTAGNSAARHWPGTAVAVPALCRRSIEHNYADRVTWREAIAISITAAATSMCSFTRQTAPDEPDVAFAWTGQVSSSRSNSLWNSKMKKSRRNRDCAVWNCAHIGNHLSGRKN